MSEPLPPPDDPERWPDPISHDEFAGRVCLVTGAAQGIGAEISRALAGHGATVVVTDVNVDGARACATAIRASGGRSTALALDVRDSAAVDQVVAEIESTCGPIEVVVNNAGLCVIGPSLETSDEEWQLHVDVMLSGPFKVARRVARGMVDRQRGAIVNICSIAAYGGWPQRTAYNTAKGGVKTLTEVLAVEWAPHGVRVNAVAPGVTRTEIMDRVLAEAGGRITLDDYDGRTPMGRVAEAKEIADGVLFLASDRAGFITGQVLAVDGGWLASDGFPTEHAS